MLDESLRFYYEQVLPEKKALVTVLNEFVKFMHAYQKGFQQLAKSHRNNLKTLILNKIDTIFSFTPFTETDPEIREIFKELEGVSYDAIVSNDLDSFKNEMQEMFKDEGIDLDLSSIETADDERDVMRKFFEAMNKARLGLDDAAPIKPKTKKQLKNVKIDGKCKL